MNRQKQIEIAAQEWKMTKGKFGQLPPDTFEAGVEWADRNPPEGPQNMKEYNIGIAKMNQTEQMLAIAKEALKEIIRLYGKFGSESVDEAKNALFRIAEFKK
jgi:hypothetical protein